jgi:hypothetical protein
MTISRRGASTAATTGKVIRMDEKDKDLLQWSDERIAGLQSRMEEAGFSKHEIDEEVESIRRLQRSSADWLARHGRQSPEQNGPVERRREKVDVRISYSGLKTEYFFCDGMDAFLLPTGDVGAFIERIDEATGHLQATYAVIKRDAADRFKEDWYHPNKARHPRSLLEDADGVVFFDPAEAPFNVPETEDPDRWWDLDYSGGYDWDAYDQWQDDTIAGYLGLKLSEQEVNDLIDKALEKSRSITGLDITVSPDGSVDMHGSVGDGVRFERIRRITGYLVGSLERFNDAKGAEVTDRRGHPVGDNAPPRLNTEAMEAHAAVQESDAQRKAVQTR